MKQKMRVLCKNLPGIGISAGIVCLSLSMACAAQTQLADLPFSSAPPAPVNLIFTPSVEFPTATVYTHKDSSYTAKNEYLGYFDPNKCYDYNKSEKYFEPVAMAGTNHSCSGSWSGNALNYGTMSGIDPFRWALTGGFRSIDTASTGNTVAGRGVTVLQRAYQNSRSAMGSRTIPGTSGSNVTITNSSLGLNVNIGGTAYQAAVRVCDDRKGSSYLEANCTPYSTPDGVITFKPVGLIQRYEDKMRFGVFSYLFNEYNPDTAPILDGGVMRSRLKNVGSSKWDGTNNPAYEWSTTTGVFVNNPDTADAAASGVSNSGVINYLNKFGFTSGGYEVYDQPSEMVAEALRYLMKKPATASYYQRANDDPRRKDGFPAITNWEDPIINACQRNAILGIGDVNTHYEYTFGDLPFDPVAWTKKLNTFEGTTGLETARWNNGGSNMMAGIAYYAHTQDIRPDIVKSVKMTLDFFWVDVMEPSGRGVSGHTEYVNKNQYWLAAKYGGFKDENGDGVFTPGKDIWNGQGRQYVGYNLPDNYYPASDPKAMVNGLEAVFSQIGSLKATGRGTGIIWQQEGGNSEIFSANYDTTNWSGDVVALKSVAVNSNDTIGGTFAWSAAEKIDAQDWNTGRKIVTGKVVDGVFSAVPFRLANLTAAQAATFDANPINQQAILEYLRGSRNGEGSVFRKRDHVLGDIVHSKPVSVGAPKEPYLEVLNPGYLAFWEAKKNRKGMIYVGANDGMLHAIESTTTGTTGGQELWAYIPSFLYSGPSNPSTPEVDGLQALSKSSYTHHYYVDATPTVADVDFDRIGTAWKESTDAEWHTLLVSGLGKGGKGYFAIDITNPGSVATESTAAGNVLWEFSPPDMGFTYGQPVVVKTPAWGWVVIVTSGYNNASGKGILYILNAKTGALIKSVDTGAGSLTAPAGFAHISAFIAREGDYMATQVYGGDLLGNLWRFDLTDADGDVKVHKLARLTDAKGQAQPVTVYPTIGRPKGGTPDHRWVFAATGQFLSTSDITGGSGTQTQTMYAIRDGGQFSTLPDSAATITRADLTQLTNLETGLTGTPDKGWYYDMTGVLAGATERVWTPITMASGYVVWTGSMPSVPADSCSNSMLGGMSTIYAVNVESGASVLTDVDGNAVRSIQVNSLVVETQVVFDENGKARLIIDAGQGQAATGAEGETSDDENNCKKLGFCPSIPSGVNLPQDKRAAPGVINWRLAN